MDEPILQFFDYAHVNANLQGVMRPYHALAEWLVQTTPRNPERTVALRKLLESMDAAIRASRFKG